MKLPHLPLWKAVTWLAALRSQSAVFSVLIQLCQFSSWRLLGCQQTRKEGSWPTAVQIFPAARKRPVANKMLHWGHYQDLALAEMIRYLEGSFTSKVIAPATQKWLYIRIWIHYLTKLNISIKWTECLLSCINIWILIKSLPGEQRIKVKKMDSSERFSQVLVLHKSIPQGCHNCAVYNLHNCTGGPALLRTLLIMYLNLVSLSPGELRTTLLMFASLNSSIPSWVWCTKITDKVAYCSQ